MRGEEWEVGSVSLPCTATTASRVYRNMENGISRSGGSAQVAPRSNNESDRVQPDRKTGDTEIATALLLPLLCDVEQAWTVCACQGMSCNRRCP